MKARIVLIVLALAAMLALSGGLSAAQGPDPRLPTGVFNGEPQAQVGSAFTYQGQLKKDGSPVNAVCTMAFSLYDDAGAGNCVGGPITTTVNVADGLFTVLLDFGEGPFTGEARWLQIAVQCPGDAAFHTLTPRQELTAAPYALSLRPGAAILGAVSDGAVLYALNTDTEAALFAYGLLGRVSSTKGYGIVGHANALSGETYGVYGRSDSTAGRGVYGLTTATDGTTCGVYGQSESTGGYGVYGESPYVGVYGETSAAGGDGVFGYSKATSSETYGVYGRADSTQGMGVFGRAAATTGYAYGVYGRSDSTQGSGVRGVATAASGYVSGVAGETASTDGYGVYGLATATSGSAVGVAARSTSTAGYGVWAWASASTGTTYGVYGRASSPDGTGVYGWAMDTAGTNSGVYGRSDSIGGRGVYGEATASGGGTGVMARSYGTQGYGVWAWASATTGTNIGVYGHSSSVNGRGVVGDAPDSGAGSGPGYAGYFYGDVHVAGTLSKSAGAFRIDHPLDPANKYLNHSFVESPDMMNIYNGNVTLDENGEAWVQLPEWFEALNRDFRYQLTCIGGYAPVYIAQEVQGNRFQIAGGIPGMKVSWQVTGIRHDPFAERNRIPVEEEKPADERGTYLYPEGYGQPKEKGLDYRRNPELFEQMPRGGR